MLTLGGLLVCGALLALAALILVFRRPAPPAWTTRAGAGELVTIALVTMLTFGLGLLAAGAIGVQERGADPIDLGLLVVLLAGTFFVWRRLDVRARLSLIERSARAGATVVPLASSGRSGLTGASDPPPPSHPSERAA